MKAAELIKILESHPDYDVILSGIEFGKCHSYESVFKNLEKDDIFEEDTYEKDNYFEIKGYWDI